MFEYHYEAYPVLINMFLFILLLFPLNYSYRGRSLVEKYRHYNENEVYKWLFLITILYCTFGYADNDFYHYKALYDYILLTGEGVHMEDFYVWLVLNLPGGYLFWRFAIWGCATLITILTFKRLNLEPKVTSCIFVLFYLVTLSIMRGNLGIAILFFGFSFWLKPIPKHLILSYLLGGFLIAVSIFFHRSMFVSILALLVTPFKLKKWQVIVSLLLFPILVVYVTDFLQLLIASQGISEDGMMGDSLSKASSYADREFSQANINGFIVRIVQYTPIVGSLIYVTWKVVFREIILPRCIYPFFIYWYAVTYVAFLFFFQETSIWIFIRFMMMGYLPMVIVLSWYYANKKPTRWMKFFLLMALIYCIYRLSYSFYNRISALS